MHETLKELIIGTHELHALPQTTARLLDKLEAPQVEAEDLLAIIEKDPALTANLLKLCNSAYYGRRREVGCVREALDMLGSRTVVTLAFATSMGKVMSGDLCAYGLAGQEMWRHALATGLCASGIAAVCDRQALRDRAFTAGLVHDIGKLLLNRLLSRRLEWSPLSTEEESLVEIERQALGFDHAEAGGALAESWHFPEMLVVAIRHHHSPLAPAEHAELVAAVHAADRIAGALGLVGLGPGPASPVPLESIADLGVPLEVARSVADQLPGQIEALSGLIGLSPEPALSPAGVA
jgi:HD-like signal output (HDOD) protein